MKNLSVVVLLLVGLFSLTTQSCKQSGCTDPNANNYDPAAVKDNGNCIYLVPVVENLAYSFEGCKPPYWVAFSYEIFDTKGDETYSWDFGDGQTSDQANPIHRYDSAGNYTATLIVQNSNGKETERIMVNLAPSYPLTAFFEDRATNQNYRSPSQILFDNLSRHATNYFWEFGDGTTSTDISPTYVYANPGRYKVRLHAICRGDTNIYEKDLEILGPPRTIEVEQIKIWLNPGFAVDTLKDPTLGLDPYIEMKYNNLPRGSSETFFDVRGFPVSWFFPADLFGGTYTFQNLNYSPSEEIKFEIWDDEVIGAHELVTFFFFNTQVWQDEYYPKLIEWEDQATNFKAFVFVKYY